MTESFSSKFTRNSILFSLPWHKNKLPNPDDIVIGHINKIEENGLVVSILDYNNIEALMPLQELSRKKLSSIRTLFKEGDIKPLLVLRVDNSKEYIDLSNKYVNMAKDEITRLDRYTTVIRLFHQWISYLSNKDKNQFDISIKESDWIEILSKTIWMYSQSEIYNILIDVKAGITKIKDVFPGLFETDLKLSFTVTDDDIVKLNKILNDIIIYSIELTVDIKITSWAINAVENIKNVLEATKSIIGSDCKLIKTTAPVYQFILTSTSKNYIEEKSNSVKASLLENMKSFEDIEIEIETKVSEKS